MAENLIYRSRCFKNVLVIDLVFKGFVGMGKEGLVVENSAKSELDFMKVVMFELCV